MSHLSFIAFAIWCGLSVGLLLVGGSRFRTADEKTNIGKFVGYFFVSLLLFGFLFIGTLALVTTVFESAGSLALWVIVYCLCGYFISRIGKNKALPFYYFCLIPLASAILLALAKSRQDVSG